MNSFVETFPAIPRDQLQPLADQWNRALAVQAQGLTDPLREEADHVVAGEIHFTDGKYVQIGRSDIDWTGSHIAHHVWQERPKRFLYLPPLMTAYQATGEEKYAEAARDYLTDWYRVHPPGPEWKMASYDNTLNLGVRIAFFADALAVFAPSPAWDDEFLRLLAAGIHSELEWISCNLSPQGNFRMKQAMTLIECGLRLSFLPSASQWRGRGIGIMNDAARRQVLADGAHVECTGGYHCWMTKLFEDCLRLQKEWPDLGFTFRPEMVSAMHDYGVASTRPNGTFAGINDIEGAWEGSHPNPRAKARAKFLQDFALPENPPSPSQFFPDAFQAFLRDSWEEETTYVTFEATRWGGAHCHLARNSVQLHAFGRSLLVDPGRINYEMSDPLGPYGKSTRAHSTLNLNGWNQFNSNPDQFRCFHAPGFDFVSAKYTGGYWPGPFGWWFFNGLGKGLAATHTRHLFRVGGSWTVIVDEVVRWKEEGRGEEYENPFLELNWQFSPGEVHLESDRLQARTNHPDANLLLHFAQAPKNSMLELHEGEKDPERGWIRDYPRFAAIPAPLISLVCRPWEEFAETFVTVLVPFRGAEVPELETSFDKGENGISRLHIQCGEGGGEEIFWRKGMETMVGAVDGLETDGLLLYRRQGSADLPAATASVDATYGPESCAFLKQPQRPSFS